MVNVKVVNFHPLCSKFNIAWGGSGRRRGRGGRSPVLLISYHRKGLNTFDLHSSLTHLKMASFIRNPH